jgi:hypothetical protein
LRAPEWLQNVDLLFRIQVNSGFELNEVQERFEVTNKILYTASVVTFAMLLGVAGVGRGQTSRGRSTPQAANLLGALPPADAVATIKLKRVFDEALPKLLAGNDAKLAEINSQIENFKTRTGLDLRSFDELALALRYTYPAEGTTKVKTVALAHGSFSPGAMVAAGRVAANGKYRQEKYQGKNIYIFTLGQRLRLLGLIDLTIRELAACPLDANTLALGDIESVRRAIDVKRGVMRANAELIALANQDAHAIMGFGGNISAAVIQNLKISNDAIAKDLAGVRQVYGSLGLSDKDLELLIAARTINPDSARNLSDTVEGLKAFGALFINKLPAAKGALAKSALENLKITTQGNELQIRTTVAQADVVPLMRGF